MVVFARGVYIGQSDFELLAINQQSQGVAIGYFDDFAVIDGLGWNRKSDQQ